jgi:hypothetical protein
MKGGRRTLAGSALVLSLLTAGCGTPKEKTAPCKRPANLSGYVSDTKKNCGPTTAINADKDAALAAIDELAD